MENQLSLIELKRREKKMKEKYSAPSFDDDTGDEGLRKSKLSYKPCALLDKFTLLFG